MGLGLVSLMKKLLVKSLILFAVNLSFIAFFLVTDIPKYTTIIILFLLALSGISILANTLFGIYEYYFGFMDVVGMFVLFLYTMIFNVLPCLIIALIYTRKSKKKV